jgi:hypothetical protein
VDYDAALKRLRNPPRRPDFNFDVWFRGIYPDADAKVAAEARAALDEMADVMWRGVLCDPQRYIDCCQGYVTGYMRRALGR